MKKDIDYRDLYYSIYSDIVEEDYKELMPYKQIFDGIREHIYLYDHLSWRSGYDKTKVSNKYMKELLNICNRTPKEILNKIDEDVFGSIDFRKAPYVLTSLNELSTIVTPSYMANKRYRTYYDCFNNIFCCDFRCIERNKDNRERTIKLYNYKDLILFAYDSYNIASFFDKYHNFLMLFFSYFYANNYSIDKVEEIMNKITYDFGYYFDLITMNMLELNNNVYEYIGSIIKEIDSNKKLIK